jgi:hypothetical protein
MTISVQSWMTTLCGALAQTVTDSLEQQVHLPLILLFENFQCHSLNILSSS